MNRRGFLRAVGAAGLWLVLHLPAAGATSRAAKARAEKIKTAIESREVLRFRYQGFVREVEPHALGTVTGGRAALLAWQTAGGSRSEPPPGWRTFIIADIERLRGLKKTFAARPEFHAGRAALKSVDVEIAP